MRSNTSFTVVYGLWPNFLGIVCDFLPGFLSQSNGWTNVWGVRCPNRLPTKYQKVCESIEEDYAVFHSSKIVSNRLLYSFSNLISLPKNYNIDI